MKRIPTRRKTLHSSMSIVFPRGVHEGGGREKDEEETREDKGEGRGGYIADPLWKRGEAGEQRIILRAWSVKSRGWFMVEP